MWWIQELKIRPDTSIVRESRLVFSWPGMLGENGEWLLMGRGFWGEVIKFPNIDCGDGCTTL